MDYICSKKKCVVRQPVKEDITEIPKCDCGEEMIPDPATRDNRAAAKVGIYRRY